MKKSLLLMVVITICLISSFALGQTRTEGIKKLEIAAGKTSGTLTLVIPSAITGFFVNAPNTTGNLSISISPDGVTYYGAQSLTKNAENTIVNWRGFNPKGKVWIRIVSTASETAKREFPIWVSWE